MLRRLRLRPLQFPEELHDETTVDVGAKEFDKYFRQGTAPQHNLQDDATEEERRKKNLVANAFPNIYEDEYYEKYIRGLGWIEY
jgi:hypothetical protein